MTITNTLVSNLTITLQPSEIALIQVSGITSRCILSSQCNSGQYVIKATEDSIEEVSANIESAIHWEFIKVSGVEYEELTFDIASTTFYSPNFIYIKNTSTGTEELRVSFRGNR